MKVLEDVFERTYNSGKFTYFFNWLGRRYAPDYMKLYEALTDEWLILHNDQKALSDESLCHFLCHCIEDILPLTEDQQRLAKDLLALDMLTFFRFHLHPDFLGWCEAAQPDRRHLPRRSLAPPICQGLSFHQLARHQDALSHLACQPGAPEKGELAPLRAQSRRRRGLCAG